jgi:uncharacterized protein (TIGR02996 family)
VARSDITSLLETATLDSLLEAWRHTPATELANLLDQVPVAELDQVITGNAVEGLARLTRIPEDIDPRIAGSLARWLAAPPWHATGAKPFYKQVFKRLGEIADPRGLATLPAARKAIKKTVKGQTMCSWLVEQIDATVATLRATRGDAPALSAADRRLVVRAGKLLAKRPVQPKQQPSKRTNAAAELLAAIRADPGDDAARQVYADVLTEKADPRGAFITMQLARAGTPPTTAQRKQELDLLAKHVRVWLGELGAVVGNLSKYMLEVGPERDRGLRFERGFLASCLLRGSRNKIAAIAAHPDLATVESLALGDHGHLVLEASELPALEELSMDPAYLDALLGCRAAARLQTLDLRASQRDEALIAGVGRCMQLPALRTLRVFLTSDGLDDLAKRTFRAALDIPQLETVHAETALGGGDYVRQGKSWSFVSGEGLPKRLADAYRAL